ncbi:MAG: hypothetical protein CSA22_07145 [Deltaproteobacteria bacterium]|nr:MAG: hypothetical protein CSA22_07145 [Deltaproteobacteria bacterium]
MGSQAERKTKIDAMKTTILSLAKNPAGFYRDMPREGGVVDPLIFMLIMAVLAAVVRVGLSAIGLGNAAPLPDGLACLVTIPVYVGLFGFAVAGILMLVWRAMAVDATFESAYRVLAYAAIALPVMELLAVIPFIGVIAGMALLLYLVVTASVAMHDIEPRLTWYTFGVIFALLAIGMASVKNAKPALDAYHQKMAHQSDHAEDVAPEVTGHAAKLLQQMAELEAHDD